MRLKYWTFILAILLTAISGTNAVYDYSIPIGIHEVKFNTSLPIWEIAATPSGTDPGYKSQYFPTYPMGFYDDPIYTGSSTILTPKEDYPWWLSLTLTVRDFDEPIPWQVMGLEMETLIDFMDEIPSGKYIGGSYAIFSIENKNHGMVIKWPSDRTEIIITGTLPSIELWRDISNSTELIR
jgi:hypothetical protein